MYFSSEVIDEIQSSVDLEDVVKATGYYVKRSAGKSNGISECPSCGRDHNHIKILKTKNIFYCYSAACGFKGNAFQWIQYVEKKSFPEAIQRVAEIGGIELPTYQSNDENLKYRNKVLEAAIHFYSKFESNYLTNRGVSEEIQKKYEVGFAPGGQELKKHLLNLGYEKELLLELGLIREVKIKDKLQTMDTFFKRVIIPIRKNGFIVDIYGRAVEEDVKYPHLYLYGQNIMFGVDNFKTGSKHALAVESIINQLTLESHGFSNIFAVGGADKFKKYHVNQLKKKGIEEVIIAYDTGDLSGAGQEGAIKTGLLLQENNIHSRVIEMPKDIDINEFFIIKKATREMFEKLVIQAKGFKEYQAYNILDSIDKDLIIKYLQEKE